MKISLCTPTKNRSADLLATLPANLNTVRNFMGQCQIIVACLDEDDNLYEHIKEKYKKDISKNILKLLKCQSPSKWHMSRAKNLFKHELEGEVYINIDADNYVTPEYIELMLELNKRHGQNFIHHGFSGTWGDGSSGRLAIGARYYREIGYDERFCPRQFEEIDFMLTVLCSNQKLPVYVNTNKTFVSESRSTSDFLKKSGLKIDFRKVNRTEYRDAITNQEKLNNDEEEIRRFFVEFNSNLCYSKNTYDGLLREIYVIKAQHAARKVCRAIGPHAAFELLFDRQPPKDTLHPKHVSIFSCMSDEKYMFESWIRYYRKAGCGKFVLINDGLDEIGIPDDLVDNVTVLKPKVGTFRICKALWIETAIANMVDAGDWVVTCDGDEFIDAGFDTHLDLNHLTKSAEQKFQSYIPALLVDMLPNSNLTTMTSDQRFEDVIGLFDHVACNELGAGSEYSAHKSVRWGFGSYWRASYVVDARYALFGTIDSLRKVPVFQWRPSLELNQGFHTLLLDGKELSAQEIWQSPVNLLIRHYKFVNLLTHQNRKRVWEFANTGAYDPRTCSNAIIQLDESPDGIIQAIKAIPKMKYKNLSLSQLLAMGDNRSSLMNMIRTITTIVKSLLRRY
jgi:hypothetical protein